MVWVKIDDAMPQHPKLAQAGPLALAMQVAGLCYSNRHLTDGFIPWAAARSLLSWQFIRPDEKGERIYSIDVCCGMAGEPVGPDFVIGLLVANEIWDEVPGGYMIHAYDEYQPTKAQVMAEREKKQASGRAGGLARAQASAKQVLKQTASKPQASPQAKSKPVPVPVPVPKEEEEPSQPAAEVQEPRLVDGTISAVDVMRAWLARAEQCAGGPVSHPLHLWRDDYETIAAALNQLPADVRHAALAALGAWFWHAGSGPIASGRLRASRATPATLAKRITADLATAHEWWHAEGKATYGQ